MTMPAGDLALWEDAEPPRRESSSLWAWMRRAPVERMTLPAAGGTWLAADILHTVAVSPLVPAAAAVLAAWAGYKRVARHAKRMAEHQGHEPARSYPADAAMVIGAAGGWAAAATAYGPGGVLGWVWLGVSFGGWCWLRLWHPGVAHARHWRAVRREWTAGRAHSFGLHGSHITAYRQTRLGEWYQLDIRGTGRRASALAGRHTAERIAERERLPVSRVLVTAGGIAGDLEVSIRDRDPWEHEFPHPLLGPDPAAELSVGGSITEPAVIGIDPETGEPLAIRLHDAELGGRRILIGGTSRYAGKTNLQSCIRERVTACRDALLVPINLSKAIEDRAWAVAGHLSAIGPEQAGRAQQVMDILCAIVDIRPRLRPTAVFRPGVDGPAIVVSVDETDTATPWIRRQISYLMSKGGSEGVTVIVAGQRGIGDYVGGRDTKALIDVVCVGKVTRYREQEHFAGPLASQLPDMTTFGGGALGVWGIAEIDGHARSGRTFKLKEPADLTRIAQDRARTQPDLEPALAAALRERPGGLYDALLGSDAYASWAAAGYPPVASGEPAHATAKPAPPAASEPDPPPDGVTLGEPETVSVTDDLEQWPVHGDQFPADPAARRAMMRGRVEQAQASLERGDAIIEQMKADGPEKVRETFDRMFEKQKASTPFPEETRNRLLTLLHDGTTSRKAAAELGVPASRVLTWLHILKDEQRARLDGKGRGARWVAAEDGDAA